jgi:ABC-type amino acid transport system permease subunit
MRDVLCSIAIVLACIVVLSAAMGAIRWAKRYSTGAQVLASAMILVLGMGVPVINPPQGGIEEAREDKGTKGAESGVPPTD